jgi:hypothetical protein
MIVLYFVAPIVFLSNFKLCFIKKDQDYFIRFAAAVLLSDYFIDTMWLQKLLQIGAFLILIIILQFFRNPREDLQ